MTHYCMTCGESQGHGFGCDEAWPEGRIDVIGSNGNEGEHYTAPQHSSPLYDDSSLHKQARYQDAKGEDWIDEFARTATADEFRGAMRFTIGKYNRRAGKKDALISEIRKMRDYCQRWEEYEMRLECD